MRQTATALIEVDKLVKRYGALTAVNGVSFTVQPGEIFGMLGPNGAGKTTTMEMIEGLRRPDAGSAKVAGFDTRTHLKKVKEVIGVQLQSTSLFDLLRVEEIVRMYASFYKISVPVEPLLDSVNLIEKKRDRVKHLSGGQKQRLAIALALVNDPQVVFLDEPTTGLDPQARRALWDIIVRMREQGKTVVLSTHYMDEAHILADRICLMDRGEVIALDTPRNLIRQLDTESAVEFRVPEEDGLAASPGAAAAVEAFAEALGAHGDVQRVDRHKDLFLLYTNDLQSVITRVIAESSARGIRLTDLQTRTATLEDVFIRMTGRSLREQ